MALAPKDGHLYGYRSGQRTHMLYRTSGDENAEYRCRIRDRQVGAFLPGIQPAARNGTARPMTGQNQPDHGRRGAMVHHRDAAKPTRRCWTANRARPGRRRGIDQPVQHLGQVGQDLSTGPAGSMPVDADTGDWKWRVKSNYPIQSGITPTAGNVVFFGDMGGNFYALDAGNGRKLGAGRSAERSAAASSPMTAGGRPARRGCYRPDRDPVADRNHHGEGIDTRAGYRRIAGRSKSV